MYIDIFFIIFKYSDIRTRIKFLRLSKYHHNFFKKNILLSTLSYNNLNILNNEYLIDKNNYPIIVFDNISLNFIFNYNQNNIYYYILYKINKNISYEINEYQKKYKNLSYKIKFDNVNSLLNYYNLSIIRFQSIFLNELLIDCIPFKNDSLFIYNSIVYSLSWKYMTLEKLNINDGKIYFVSSINPYVSPVWFQNIIIYQNNIYILCFDHIYCYLIYDFNSMQSYKLYFSDIITYKNQYINHIFGDNFIYIIIYCQNMYQFYSINISSMKSKLLIFGNIDIKINKLKSFYVKNNKFYSILEIDQNKNDKYEYYIHEIY
jgi:hypothetical protein